MAKARGGLAGRQSESGPVELDRQRMGQRRMGKELMEQGMGDDSGKGRFLVKAAQPVRIVESPRGEGEGKQNRAGSGFGSRPTDAKAIRQGGPLTAQPAIAGSAQEKGQFPYLARLGSRSMKLGTGAQKKEDLDEIGATEETTMTCVGEPRLGENVNLDRWNRAKGALGGVQGGEGASGQKNRVQQQVVIFNRDHFNAAQATELVKGRGDSKGRVADRKRSRSPTRLIRGDTSRRGSDRDGIVSE